MGRYVNPNNEGFAKILRSKYVDKTGLISVFVSTLNVAGQKLVMVSRPRRFGKSYAEVTRNLDVPVLLVGVSYDPKTKEHACRIELRDE